MTERTDRLIQRTAMVSIVVMMVVTTLVVLKANGAFGHGARAAGPSYKVGALIDIPTEHIVSAKMTLLVFARSTCGACRAARPVLAKAVDLVATRPQVQAQLMAVAGLGESEQTLADELGISRTNVRTYDQLTKTQLHFVPTVMVLDAVGKILYVYEGAPPAEELAKIATILDK